MVRGPSNVVATYAESRQDLTTYKVAADAPVLSVDEVTVGDGGLCGSVYLNRRFEDLIRKKIGKELDALPKTVTDEAMSEVQISRDAIAYPSLTDVLSRFIESSMKRYFDLRKLGVLL